MTFFDLVIAKSILKMEESKKWKIILTYVRTIN